MKRLTIRDIADAAGVSPGAVSFALNDKPGVSSATRARILATATAMGWTPNPAARALSSSRSGNVGLVITRPPHTIRDENFYFPFTCGIAETLSEAGLSLVLRMAQRSEDEKEIYREWARLGRVDGVILVDIRSDDPRAHFLASQGVPCVSVGSDPGVGSAIVLSDAEAMATIVTHIFAQGFRQPAYVSGIRGFEHTQVRRSAFEAACRDVGWSGTRSYVSDYTEDAGAAITRSILTKSPEVDMIIYDNDMLTYGGLAYLRARGIAVPAEVGVFSWEDSPLCRVLQPAVSALSRDPERLGVEAGQLLRRTLDSGERIVESFAQPTVIARATTTRLPLAPVPG